MREELSFKTRSKIIIKKCHVCGKINESTTEQARCGSCNKSFLPLNYFAKIHDHGSTQYENLFSDSHELSEEDLVKGIYVLW